MRNTMLLIGDVRSRLADIASESVHCIVTSPPYFGLRNYGTGKWLDGKLDCQHYGSERYYTTQSAPVAAGSAEAFTKAGAGNAARLKAARWREGGTCVHCGASYHDEQIGLEATPDAYVAQMVAVFRECRRVLRSDGVFWLNLGDSYSQQGKWGGSTSGKHVSQLHGDNDSRKRREFGLATKQRLMIPARVALALQADGWWLRDEIIWHKPNPMPISVTDRTTPAHEMLYMFSKSARYHYDMDAIKEPIAESSRKRYAQPTIHQQAGGAKQDAYESGFVVLRSRSRRPNEILKSLADSGEASELRQPRSVWSIPTRPFKGAHFATFPPDLIRPCILAGCPPSGTVLDPFFGAGTTGLVAAEHGRNCIGIELNAEYAAICAQRLGLKPLATDLLGRVDALPDLVAA
jgi:DNA modification methylase